VPAREKASKTIGNVDLATIINPQTWLKKAMEHVETKETANGNKHLKSATTFKRTIKHIFRSPLKC